MKINELSKIQPSKTVIPAWSKKLTQGYREGNESAVEIATKLDFISKVCTEAKKELSEAVIKEIEAGDKTKNGYSLKVTESGVKYDFSKCNDPELKGLEAELSELSKKIETRQKFLKALPWGGTTIVDENTGEVTKIYPPAKKSTTVPQFTLQK